MRAVRAYGCVLVVVLAACRSEPAAPSVVETEGARAVSASPRSMKELVTTDHEIAVGNLQAQIADYEKRLAKAPGASGIENIDEPGGGRRVRLREPNGYQIEVVCGIAPVPEIQVKRQKLNSGEAPLSRTSKNRPLTSLM